ncbi:hypothetical protein ScPMuIL_016414 [Solemya velum]
MVEQLQEADYALLALYFVVVMAVGLWSTFRPGRDNAAGYFLAGKSMHWIPIGASIFASNVGAPMFIGLAGTAAASGFAVVIYEWHGVFLCVALGWLFVPVYVASGAFTLPEYLKKRFGGKRLRIYLSIMALVIYILTRITTELYSGAIFLRQLLGWNVYLSIIVILAVTGLYTVVGGLAAVMYTDTLQTVILLLGSSILTVIGFVEIGGWNAMMTKYGQAATNYTLANRSFYACGLPREDFDHIFRDPVTSDIPWPGIVFGATTLGLYFFCSDQLMVQRCLAAKSLGHAKAGALMAGTLKILPFFLFMIPGMISRILFPDDVACADPDKCEQVCGNRAGCTNIAYPLFVLRKLPTGLRGLMLAALLAALMSSLTSIFNSSSTMFTMDIWRKFRRHARQGELMIVGRVSVLVQIGFSILWIPVMEASQGGQMWSYIQAVASYSYPPWCMIFLFAIFWKRTTEQGAFYGLMAGLVTGVARMIVDFVNPAPTCGSQEEDTRPPVLKKVHFLHFAIIVAVVTTIVTLVISLMTKPRPPEKLRRVTWWTRHDPDEPEVSDSEEEIEDDEVEEVPKMPMTNDKYLEELNHPGITPKKTVRRKVYNWVCGISDKPHPKLTDEERKAVRDKMTSLEENPHMKRILDISAFVVAIGTVFLVAFFA